MKKLISLMMLMLGCGTALAEETTAAASSVDWSQVSLLVKGLIVTAGGLGGTFLVLILFFLMIKVMHKLLK